jgi:hypothetical protein
MSSERHQSATIHDGFVPPVGPLSRRSPRHNGLREDRRDFRPNSSLANLTSTAAKLSLSLWFQFQSQSHPIPSIPSQPKREGRHLCSIFRMQHRQRIMIRAIVVSCCYLGWLAGPTATDLIDHCRILALPSCPAPTSHLSSSQKICSPVHYIHRTVGSVHPRISLTIIVLYSMHQVENLLQ